MGKKFKKNLEIMKKKFIPKFRSIYGRQTTRIHNVIYQQLILGEKAC